MTLRIGTRGSRLALAQANEVKALLEQAHPGLACELEVIRTGGDDFSAGKAPVRPFDSAVHPELVEGERPAQAERAAKGLFVKEIEEALLQGRVDLAVHSAKDLETELPKGLKIAAIPKREDPRDALVARDGAGLKDLPRGARVGASSLRRQAQLARLRRDLELRPVRGNVETRLKKLDAGEYDALVLASAGLRRLGLGPRITQPLQPAEFLPSPGQGALAVEIREARADLEDLLRAVDEAASHAEIQAERAFLRALGGSCRVPIGALARVSDGTMNLEGVVLSPDGLKAVRKAISGPAASSERLGAELASHLRAAGADRLLYGAWAAKTVDKLKS